MTRKRDWRQRVGAGEGGIGTGCTRRLGLGVETGTGGRGWHRRGQSWQECADNSVPTIVHSALEPGMEPRIPISAFLSSQFQ